jgi:hypothetical protein
MVKKCKKEIIKPKGSMRINFGKSYCRKGKHNLWRRKISAWDTETDEYFVSKFFSLFPLSVQHVPSLLRGIDTGD